MKKVTRDMITSSDSDAIAVFERVFPDGALANRQSILTARENRISLYWLINRPFTDDEAQFFNLEMETVSSMYDTAVSLSLNDKELEDAWMYYTINHELAIICSLIRVWEE